MSAKNFRIISSLFNVFDGNFSFFNLGAVTSTTEKLYIYDGKLSELSDTPDGSFASPNKKIISNRNDNLSSDNEDDRISKDFYTSDDDIVADLDDK